MTREAEDPAPDPRAATAVGGCLYAALLAGGLLWLWSRDRLGILPERAIGAHGAPLAAAAGLAVGLAGAGLAAVASRRSARLRGIEAKVRGMFASIAEAPQFALVVGGAIAEEVFFRLAAQDALGLVGSVAAYVLLTTTTAGWLWLPVAALHATALGLLMHCGFGLLGSTTANAVLNYLSLRRIVSS
ncbi:MAG: hypothetical protein FJ265_06980 [Planctomycetes bacterium]|nr:hypothetical protein [Planctomycetota bacterium]